MCTETDAKRLIQEALEGELEDPVQSRKKYLEAAEIMLLLSEQNKEHEEKCVQLAGILYDKSETLKTAKPIIKQAAKTSLTFADIGGLHKLKEEIRFKIIEPFNNPSVYQYFGKNVGGGIVMYGPPGCGKSLIAEATSNEAGAAFFHVKASDLKGKYVGETEKNIAELFKKARAQAPSIIFFDEFEALGSDRTNSPVHERNSVAQLLTEMDGVGSKNQQILLLAATNEPWSLDSALLREGRFGTTLFIPPPDLDSRKDILKLCLAGKPLAADVSLGELAKKTDKFSGADLKALCEKATDIPLREYFKTKKLRPLTQADFEKALNEVKSVIPLWMRKAEATVKKLGMEETFPDISTAKAPLQDQA
ncbi:AAA family ATPase [Candidatus Woesearchaeota archaeon]|nr:AAA family ATPase [Candidatus Woesearchaeota archaeon]